MDGQNFSFAMINKEVGITIMGEKNFSGSKINEEFLDSGKFGVWEFGSLELEFGVWRLNAKAGFAQSYE